MSVLAQVSQHKPTGDAGCLRKFCEREYYEKKDLDLLNAQDSAVRKHVAIKDRYAKGEAILEEDLLQINQIFRQYSLDRHLEKSPDFLENSKALYVEFVDHGSLTFPRYGVLSRIASLYNGQVSVYQINPIVLTEKGSFRPRPCKFSVEDDYFKLGIRFVCDKEREVLRGFLDQRLLAISV